MSIKRLRNADGVTLLEVTLAVAIFAVAMGAAAQTLISFYTTMDVQNQRVVAINHARSVLSDMRTLRDQFPNSATTPTNFQTNLLAQYPNGTVLTGPSLLRGSQVTITYESTNPTTNPMVPTIMVQWNDLRGHQCRARVTSALTDR